MLKRNEKSRARKSIAFKNYTAARDAVSEKIYETMQSDTRHKNFNKHLSWGLVAGLVMAPLVGLRHSNVPVKDDQGRTIEYKINVTKMSKIMINTLVLSVLVALGSAVYHDRLDAQINRLHSSDIVKDLYKKCFSGAINGYSTDIHSVEAAVFLINNLSSQDHHSLIRLEELATKHLQRDNNGDYFIAEDAVQTATQIISEFVRNNPIIGKNIKLIMKGGNPDTYFIPKQNAR